MRWNGRRSSRPPGCSTRGISSSAIRASPFRARGGVAKLKPQVEALERSVIEEALARASGNRRLAASTLGVSLRTLFYKLHRYGLGDE